MNYFFKKYEFDNEDIFIQLKNNLPSDHTHFIVELGILRNDKYSVDVLWSGSLPNNEWEIYEIDDVEGNGAHTFFGWNFNNLNQNNDIII